MRGPNPFAVAAVCAPLLILSACSERREAAPEPEAPPEEAALVADPEPEAMVEEAAEPAPPAPARPRSRRPASAPAEPEPPPVVVVEAKPPAPVEQGETLAEFRARADRLFDRLDADRDGMVSLDEVHDRLGHGARADWLARHHAVVDGRLGREGVRSAVTDLFRRLDTDGNGMVTASERVAGGDPFPE